MRAADVLLQSIHLLKLNREHLSRSLAIPAFLLILFSFVPDEVGGIYVDVAAYALTVFLQTIVAVTVHRTLLIGPKSVPTWGLSRFTARELVFAGHVVLLGSLLWPIEYLARHSLLPLAVLLLIITLWLTSRVSLCFPSIAIDKFISVFGSWKRTGKHQASMFAVCVAYPFMLALLIVPVAMFGTITGEPYSVISTAVISAYSVVLTVVTVALLSIAYRQIVGGALES